MNKPGYKVEVECVYSWADYTWVWRVYDPYDQDIIAWHGTTTTRWGAHWAAKRAVKKLWKGRTMTDKVRPNPETFWMPL